MSSGAGVPELCAPSYYIQTLLQFVSFAVINDMVSAFLCNTVPQKVKRLRKTEVEDELSIFSQVTSQFRPLHHNRCLQMGISDRRHLCDGQLHGSSASCRMISARR